MARIDLWTGIGLVVLGAWVFYLTESLPKVPQGIGPGEYPRVAAAGLVILGGLLSVEALRKMPFGRGRIFTAPGLLRILTLAVLTFGYILSMEYVGFLLGSPVYLFLAMLLFRVERKLIAAATSVVLTAAVHLVFYHFFQVVLPKFSLW